MALLIPARGADVSNVRGTEIPRFRHSEIRGGVLGGWSLRLGAWEGQDPALTHQKRGAR